MMRVVAVKDALKDKTFEEVGAFRHKLFCEKRNWKTGLEIYQTGISDPDKPGKLLLAERDEFDSLNEAVYFISYNINQKIDGIVRFQSTEYPYMLQKDFFKNIPGFINGELPVSPRVWEASRTGCDPDMNKEQQFRVTGNLVTAYFEFSIKNNIHSVLGSVNLAMIYLFFGKSGCTIKGNNNDDVQHMGAVVNILDPLSGSVDKNSVAARLRISPDAYARVMKARGTSKNTLYTLAGDKIFPGIQVLSRIPHKDEKISDLLIRTR
ncbi:MAG: hypothetical protein FWE52_01675 [Alphaproteobacteria bacterium]|nr:hypothetical protein [Alphaproteobacteria bacterium]